MKVSVIGAGNVGGAVASRLAANDVASEIALVDVAPGLAQGTALDIAHRTALDRSTARVTGSTDVGVTETSDVIVVTAGRARRPGESRADLTAGNAAIVHGAVAAAAARSPFAVLIVVTNPLDEMTHLAWEVSGYPPERVMGMAGVLDSARYRYLLAEALGGHAHEVEAMTLGSHGDTMVPVPSLATFRGRRVTDILPRAVLDRVAARTRDAGADVVALLRRGSAFHAPGASVAAMVAAVAGDTKETLPACVWLTGQYGISDVFLGVPAVLGRRGVEGVVEVRLAEDELVNLRSAAATVRQRTGSLRAARPA